MSKCILEISDDLLLVKAPYKKGFITGIKDIVPGEHRYFDFQDKVWELHPDYLDEMVDLAQKFYTNVFVDELVVEDAVKYDRHSEDEKAVAQLKLEISILKKNNTVLQNKINERENGSGSWGTLRKYINNKVLDKLHKALALSYHPDKGGRTEDMQIVNELMSKLKKGLV